MSRSVKEIMVPDVIVARSDESIFEIRQRMSRHGIHAIPVLDERDQPVGIITSSDLVDEIDSGRQVAEVMTAHVYTVSQNAGTHIAASQMRNLRVHHLVVTDDREVVGILSALDLLRLVEEGE